MKDNFKLASTESRIIEIDLDFVEKFKFEVEGDFWIYKSRNWWNLNEIKL